MAYKGLVAPLNVGFGGFTGTRNPSIIQPGKLTRAMNITFEGGLLQKEGGAALYDPDAITNTPLIVGGFDWWPDDSTQRMIVITDDGDILKDDGTGAFGTTLASGLTITEDTVPVFVEGGIEVAGQERRLFIFLGTDQPQVFTADESTTTTIGAEPVDWDPDWPTFGFLHADAGQGAARLWAGGNPNDPHRLYASLISDHDNLTASGTVTVSIYPGEGQKLVGGVSWRGVAILFKYPRGIYILDTTEFDSPLVQRLSSTVGAAGPGAICPVENDIFFMTHTGAIHALSAVQSFGDAETSNLSQADDLDEWIRRNVDLSALHRTRSIWYPAKREAHFCVQSIGGSSLDRRIILDLSQVGNLRFRLADRDSIGGIWLRRDDNGVERPVYGDTGGLVYLMDQESRTKGDSFYRASFNSSPDDLSLIMGDPRVAVQNKNAEFLEVVAVPDQGTTLSVQIWWDGVYHETVQFDLVSSGSALPLTLPFLLGSGGLIRQKKRITGGGRDISLRVEHDDTNNFAIAQFYLHYTMGDEAFLRR